MYSGDTSTRQQSKSYHHSPSSRLTTSGGYLARPKLGALKNLFSKASSSMRPLSYYGLEKKKKARKSSVPKMDYRKKPDYADTAYREAVSRLRILLAESYTPIKRPLRELDSAGEETDNQSVVSGLSRTSRLGHAYYHSKPTIQKKYPYYTPTTPRTTFNVTNIDAEKAHTDPQSKWDTNTAPPELMTFIERQEEYIEQLEKESRFCREELSTLLAKVKDVISENENLHEKQKNHLIKSVFDHLETETETETELELGKKSRVKSKSPRRNQILEGPTIVFESRISELEAQLTQAKIDLKKAHDENDSFRKKIADGTIGSELGFDTYKKQIDGLQREKNVLQETITKLQNALSQLREKENDCTDKVKRSLDVAEQAQYEKTAAEHEIRRLKDELERQHSKVRDTITEQSRRIADERNAVERRYTQQIEQLTNELGVQWETASKLQLELDKQRREDSDLRRELAQKQAYIDELKKEMQNKILSMQSDIGVSSAEKSALEQQIASLQMANERSERQAKQEQARLQAEMQSLRQRLDRADADLIHSRRENIRLTEQVAALEKEININAALSDERSKRSSGGDLVALPPPTPKKDDRELSSMIKDMESKHVATVAELEGMIHSQNQLMDKLSNECHALTQKLEDASARHKEEIRELQTNLDLLKNRLGQRQVKPPDIKDNGSSIFHESTPAEHPPLTPKQRFEPTIAPRLTSTAPIRSPTIPAQDNLGQILRKSTPEPTTKTAEVAPPPGARDVQNTLKLSRQPEEAKTTTEKEKDSKEIKEEDDEEVIEERVDKKLKEVESKTEEKDKEPEALQIKDDVKIDEPIQLENKESTGEIRNEPLFTESEYQNQQYFDQQAYNQEQYEQQPIDQQHYGQQPYNQQEQYNPYGVTSDAPYMQDPNQQQYDPNQPPYNADQPQYDPNLYGDQTYDQNNPNPQYISQEQYDQQYGYSGDPTMQYDANYGQEEQYHEQGSELYDPLGQNVYQQQDELVAPQPIALQEENDQSIVGDSKMSNDKDDTLQFTEKERSSEFEEKMSSPAQEKESSLAEEKAPSPAQEKNK